MASTFKKFGVTMPVLEATVKRLASKHGPVSEEYIYIDNHDRHIVLELLPAGTYFVDTLSISREYAFWNGLISDVSCNLLPRGRFKYEETQQDKFKYDVVINVIRDVLIPSLEREVRALNDSNYALYRRYFAINGAVYQERMVLSILGTIEFSSLDHPGKEAVRAQLEEMQRTIRGLVGRVRDCPLTGLKETARAEVLTS
ncbi:hypothetical protein YTPLAS18_20480 [Nitrospira sp.]|nr:hypothetical protein YTPLAS18_20480 [Nitrospira sp.]